MKDLLTELPLTLGFRDDALVGKVLIDNTGPQIPNIHEYFFAPSYARGHDGTWQVLSYGLVHRSLLPSHEELERREAAS